MHQKCPKMLWACGSSFPGCRTCVLHEYTHHHSALVLKHGTVLFLSFVPHSQCHVSCDESIKSARTYLFLELPCLDWGQHTQSASHHRSELALIPPGQWKLLLMITCELLSCDLKIFPCNACTSFMFFHKLSTKEPPFMYKGYNPSLQGDSINCTLAHWKFQNLDKYYPPQPDPTLMLKSRSYLMKPALKQDSEILSTSSGKLSTLLTPSICF